MPDYKKLQSFVEAAISDPRHPVYKLGMAHSPILQHYAVNVTLLGAIKPEQWFRENAERTAKIEQVMALCEAEDESAGELDALKAKVADLEARLAAQPAPSAPETPAEVPAPETPAVPSAPAGQDA